MSISATSSSKSVSSSSSKSTSSQESKSPSSRTSANSSGTVSDSVSDSKTSSPQTESRLDIATDREQQQRSEAEAINAIGRVAATGGYSRSTAVESSPPVSSSEPSESPVPDPSSPEYGQQLIEGMAEKNPTIADGMRLDSPRLLSFEETEELLDHVSSSPEIGGFDSFVQSMSKDNNGYLTGPDATALASRAAANVVEGEAVEPSQVSQSTIDGLIESDRGFGAVYDRARAQLSSTEEAFNKHVDILENTESVSEQAVWRGPDSPLEHNYSDLDGNVAQVRTDLNGFSPLLEELRPGLTTVVGGAVFMDTDGQGSGGQALSTEQLETFSAEALALASESQDLGAQRLAERSLAILGGEGGRAGAQKVAYVYQELGLALPSYLAQALAN